MTERRFLTQAPGVPEPTSPISHAVVAGDSCWISGQHAVDDEGVYRPATASAEARRAFELVFRVATAAGFAPEDIVFVDLAFADLADIAEVNGLFETLFAPARRPARTVHQAARLAFGAKIRVHAIAVRGGARPQA